MSERAKKWILTASYASVCSVWLHFTEGEGRKPFCVTLTPNASQPLKQQPDVKSGRLSLLHSSSSTMDGGLHRNKKILVPSTAVLSAFTTRKRPSADDDGDESENQSINVSSRLCSFSFSLCLPAPRHNHRSYLEYHKQKFFIGGVYKIKMGNDDEITKDWRSYEWNRASRENINEILGIHIEKSGGD